MQETPIINSTHMKIHAEDQKLYYERALQAGTLQIAALPKP